MKVPEGKEIVFRGRTYYPGMELPADYKPVEKKASQPAGKKEKDG